MFSAKVAVTVLSPSMTSVVGVVAPVSAPPQPRKLALALGTAVRVTVSPFR